MAELVDGFTVREASDSLGVSRVRIQHMITDGSLRAELVGSRWIIPRHEVFRMKRLPRHSGRPYSPETCWEIVDELETGRRPLNWLGENWYRLTGRARHTTGRMLTDLIADVFDDERVVLGGAHAAAVRGAATRPFHPPLDVYVADSLAGSYLSSVGFRPFTAEPNITMHTVTDQQWEHVVQSRTVSLVVAYLDLMEAGDRGAVEVLHQLRSGRP
jgi:excisionase family DNA binding protein